MAWVSTKEAVQSLGVCRQTLLRRVKSGAYTEGVHVRKRSGRSEYNLLTIQTPVGDIPQPPVELKKQQQEAWNTLMPLILNRGISGVLRLTGYAGTGKTFLCLAMARTLQNLDYKVSFIAPTHSALSVIAKKASEFDVTPSSGSPLGQTICRAIASRRHINGEGAEFFRATGSVQNWPGKADVVFVDESSMIGEVALAEVTHCLENYFINSIIATCDALLTKKNQPHWSSNFTVELGINRVLSYYESCGSKEQLVAHLDQVLEEEIEYLSQSLGAQMYPEKADRIVELVTTLRSQVGNWPNAEQRVVFVGDPGQLPPVNEDNSPALLDPRHMSFHLDQVARYDGAILDYATRIRTVGEGLILPAETNSDLQVLPNNEWLRQWERDVLEGMDSRIVTWTNAAVLQYVDRIRKLLFNDPTPPSYIEGEQLISFGQVRDTDGRRVAPASTELTLTGIREEQLNVLIAPNWQDLQQAIDTKQWAMHAAMVALPGKDDDDPCGYDPTWWNRCQAVIKKYQLRADFLYELKSYKATANWQIRSAWQSDGLVKKTAEVRLLPRDMYAKIGGGGFQRQCSNRLAVVDPDSDDAFVLKVMIECCRTAFTRVEPRSVMTAHRSQGSTFHTAYVDYDSFRKNKRPRESNKMLYTAVTRASDRVMLSHTPAIDTYADWDDWL